MEEELITCSGPLSGSKYPPATTLVEAVLDDMLIDDISPHAGDGGEDRRGEFDKGIYSVAPSRDQTSSGGQGASHHAPACSYWYAT